MAEALDTYSDLDLSDSDGEGESGLLNKKFKVAADHIKSLVSKVDSTKLLQIYSYYKQATEGQCNIPRPKWYDVQAKQKWDAWNSLADLSPDVAKDMYINIVSELDPGWDKNFKDGNMKNKSNSQHWVTVSSLCKNEDEELNEADKTIFDFCKDGDVWHVQTLLQANPILLNELDPDGLGLIHWAADRGYLDMIRMLIKLNCDLSLKDELGQTALHYAVSCDHIECTRLLLESGVDKTIKNDEDMTAADLATDESIKIMLTTDSFNMLLIK